MAGDLNFIVFKSKNSVGMEKIARHFPVAIFFINHYWWGQKLKYNFPLGTIFWPIFPVGMGPVVGSVRKKVLKTLS